MKININGQAIEVEENNATILEVMQVNQIEVDAPCGGNGTCGKCKVDTRPAAPITDSEKEYLNLEDLNKGVRLACMQYPIDGYEYLTKTQQVMIEDWITHQDITFNPKVTARIIDPSNMNIKEAKGMTKIHNVLSSDIELIKDFMERLNDKKAFKIIESEELIDCIPIKDTLYGCAIDIGTTTVVMKFFNLENNTSVHSEAFTNPQKKYGADVISRISFAIENSGNGLLVKEIQEKIYSCLEDFGDVHHLVISGNTVMSHLFLDMDIRRLGTYPFNYAIDHHLTCHQSQIFKDSSRGLIDVIPPLSAFVGGDITSGILGLGIHESKKWSLLLDLGTNGEIALANNEGIWVTSTAAGPVFEGASLDCGMLASPGAIHNISSGVKTIDNVEPLGICGTGAISILAHLFDNNLIDHTGRFIGSLENKEHYSITNEIFLSQKDVRTLQTAKSAIRTGIEILMDAASIEAGDIENVYIAGGFGNNIDVQSFITVGILPKEFKESTKPVGNSSLNGAIMYMLNKDMHGKISAIKSMAKAINLSEHPKFQDYYVDYMYFLKEE